MPISHVFNCTIADDAAAQAAGEILPSHWNATHNVLINLTSEVSGVLAASNGGMATGFTGTNASGTLNSNGLALSVNAGGAAAFSGGVSTGGNTLGSTGTVSNQIVFAGGNNITLSQSTNVGGATVTISAFNQSNQTVASGNIAGTGFTSTTVAGTDIAGTLNTAGLLLAVPNYLTTSPAQSVQPVAISGSNGSFAFSTLTAGNLNGLSFYTSNGSMVGSYTVPSVPAQTNQTIGLYGVSNTTGASSSSTIDARSFSIQGAGAASVGLSNLWLKTPISTSTKSGVRIIN